MSVGFLLKACTVVSDGMNRVFNGGSKAQNSVLALIQKSLMGKGMHAEVGL